MGWKILEVGLPKDRAALEALKVAEDEADMSGAEPGPVQEYFDRESQTMRVSDRLVHAIDGLVLRDIGAARIGQKLEKLGHFIHARHSKNAFKKLAVSVN
jgi:hypothetical protein